MRILRSAALACLLAGCDPFHVEFDAVEPSASYQARKLSAIPEAPEALRVMTWNIKFGGGRSQSVALYGKCSGRQHTVRAGSKRTQLA